MPVPSQRSQALSLPVTLSVTLPVPAHSGQRSSAVPGVPGSGSSSGVCGLRGFDFMVGILPPFVRSRQLIGPDTKQRIDLTQRPVLQNPEPKSASLCPSRHPPQSVAACLSCAARRILSRMGTKSRERSGRLKVLAAWTEKQPPLAVSSFPRQTRSFLPSLSVCIFRSESHALSLEQARCCPEKDAGGILGSARSTSGACRPSLCQQPFSRSCAGRRTTTCSCWALPPSGAHVLVDWPFDSVGRIG